MEKPIKVAIAGHFNPAHIGHLLLIKSARALGDSLTVIVANDTQAKAKRPKIFMPVEERACIIARLKDVDEVIISIDKDSSVKNTLQFVKPDIFASGCGEDDKDAMEEAGVCHELGIKTVFKVGGDRINSSTEILNNYEKRPVRSVRK
jgi:cytidyltransferase-like protein